LNLGDEKCQAICQVLSELIHIFSLKPVSTALAKIIYGVAKRERGDGYAYYTNE